MDVYLNTVANEEVFVRRTSNRAMIIRYISELTLSHFESQLTDVDVDKPDKSQGRNATGPRFLRDATDDLPKDPKIAAPPQRHSMYSFLILGGFKL